MSYKVYGNLRFSLNVYEKSKESYLSGDHVFGCPSTTITKQSSVSKIFEPQFLFCNET